MQQFSVLSIPVKTIATVATAFFLNACSESDEAPSLPGATASATYKVTFTTSWTAAAFPINFPGGAHFSALTGATHNNQVQFWQDGQIASDGIEVMAETGVQGTLIAEVEAAKNAGSAQFSLTGSGAGAANVVSFEFGINPAYPQVTLVSMVAPSPDWFVGVRNLPLFDDVTNDWKPTVSVDLAVYDAGTDSGLQFESGDSNTQPAEIISRLNSNLVDTDFVNGVSPAGDFIATFTFERVR